MWRPPPTRYSDNGLWYVPTAAEYPKGGYEVGVTFVADRGPAGVKEGCEHLEGDYVAAIVDLLEVSLFCLCARGLAARGSVQTEWMVYTVSIVCLDIILLSHAV